MFLTTGHLVRVPRLVCGLGFVIVKMRIHNAEKHVVVFLFLYECLFLKCKWVLKNYSKSNHTAKLVSVTPHQTSNTVLVFVLNCIWKNDISVNNCFV